MRGRQRRSIGELIHEVNMTPLIDVSLVLVVILLVATPLAFQSSIALSTAASGSRAAAKAASPDRVEIEVISEGTVRVDHDVVPRQDLDRTLRPKLDQSASHLVVVRCADGVSHGTFVNVIDRARALGAFRIAVVGH